jgi:hypothetical protein
MFVRWSIRKQDARRCAALVESVRIDGQPRQRHIAYLASIIGNKIDNVHRRRWFWDRVHDRLDRLGNRMTIEERRRIEKIVAAKVPRLSREEHEASVREYSAIWTTPPPQPPYRPPG